MQDMEKERRCIQQALSHLSPDEDAKDRMYYAVLQRASQQPVKKKAWYLRWQTSAGVCAAAMACVVVMLAAVHGRMPQNGSEQLPIVQLQTMATTISDSSSGTLPLQTTGGVDSQPKKTTTISRTVQENADSETETRAASEECQTEMQLSATEAPMQAVQVTSKEGESHHAATVTEPKETQVSQTQPTAKKTEPTVMVTTAGTATRTEPSEIQPSVTTAALSSEEDPSEEPPIQQNIYLYHKLTWNDVYYDTQYVETASRGLIYLGSAVTCGESVDDTYVVLVYAISGTDPTQRLAVQYAGKDAYYIFTAQ